MPNGWRWRGWISRVPTMRSLVAVSTTRPMSPAKLLFCVSLKPAVISSICANLSHVPSLPKTITAIAGATIGAALAYPPSRRQLVRTARAAMDEVLLRVDTPWSQDLLLVTTAGHRSKLPRTSVLARVELDGATFVVPWDRGAGWLRNVEVTPDVGLDDRAQVRP